MNDFTRASILPPSLPMEVSLNYLKYWFVVLRTSLFIDSQARGIAQSCLYLCLDYGLKLIHPIMPFVTEELWQRLPGRGKMGKNMALSKNT